MGSCLYTGQQLIVRSPNEKSRCILVSLNRESMQCNGPLCKGIELYNYYLIDLMWAVRTDVTDFPLKHGIQYL